MLPLDDATAVWRCYCCLTILLLLLLEICDRMLLLLETCARMLLLLDDATAAAGAPYSNATAA